MRSINRAGQIPAIFQGWTGRRNDRLLFRVGNPFRGSLSHFFRWRYFATAP